MPSAQLEWHGHNDFHKVQVNAAAAWLYGCSAVNTAIFGSGERTGNTPLEAMVIEHAQIKGMIPGVNYAAITELADYARKELGFEIPRELPAGRQDFNVTRAGIHADGLLKNEEIYNCFDTQKLLNRPDRRGDHGQDRRRRDQALGRDPLRDPDRQARPPHHLDQGQDRCRVRGRPDLGHLRRGDGTCGSRRPLGTSCRRPGNSVQRRAFSLDKRRGDRMIGFHTGVLYAVR